MKYKSILLSVSLASLLQAEQITSIEYINLNKISQTIANETLKFKVGEKLNIDKINSAIKKFYKFNYFDDIQVTMNNGKIQFIFDEKPSIINVEIEGYKERKDDIEILKKQIGISKGNMYSSKRLKKAKNSLIKELEREGYINSVVEVDIEHISEDSVSVIFNVNKGEEIIIKKVNYFGAKNIDHSSFENITVNKEEEFASWFITQNDGELKAEQLEYDGKRIKELYLEYGYLDANVKNPFLEVDFSSNQANLDFYINEGSQYKANKIKIYLDSTIMDPKKIYPELSLKKDKVFNIKKLRKDAAYIKTLIADLGYAFAQVQYDIRKNTNDGTADIIFNIIPGNKVYIRDVKVSGNSRSLDRIIRRDVYLAPGDLFNLTDFNDSKSKLKRAAYFDKVSIVQRRVSEDKMDLIVKVVEASTGNIILGGGYGSYNKFTLSGSIEDKNIFGSGLGLSVSADLSAKKSDLSIKLKNPAIKDSKYHGEFDIHSDQKEINKTAYNLNKKTKGFPLSTGKEIIRNLNMGATYRLDSIKEDYNYKDNVVKEAGKRYYGNTDYITSSITPYLRFNNTDDFYVPREGFKINSSLEFAGLGGDSKYLKSSSYLRYFYSLNDLYDLDWILRYKLQGHFLVDNGQINQGDSLYLGGTKSLRGFKSYALGPNNKDGVIEDPYKGMASTSFELSFPLSEAAKMRWGLFYDYGMIGREKISDIKRSSVGGIFEWISPFGPIQFIFAKPLDNKKEEDTSSFEFSVGSSF